MTFQKKFPDNRDSKWRGNYTPQPPKKPLNRRNFVDDLNNPKLINYLQSDFNWSNINVII